MLRRAKLLTNGGIDFVSNCEIGIDISFSELREKHDAVLIATGVYKSRDIQVPGIGLNGVVPALDFLTASNCKSLGDDVAEFDSGVLNAGNKNVVVIGGGDTAMDCVRTAIRQNAKLSPVFIAAIKSTCLVVSAKCRMRRKKGSIFNGCQSPHALLGDGSVQAVRARRIHLGQPDETGRQVPQIIENSDFDVDADLVIKALGFDPEDLPVMFDYPELGVSKWGTIQIDWKTMMTSLPGVFAAGDIVRGASLVVWGIRDGRDAAEQMDKYIQAEQRGVSLAVG